MDNEDSLERFKDLLSDIPLEYVQLSNEIIAFAKSSIGIALNQNVYLTMIDHIHFYPKEHLIGKYALRLIEERTGLRMPDDEAASIALHLVNAEYDSGISDTFRMTEMIREMVERIEDKSPQY